MRLCNELFENLDLATNNMMIMRRWMKHDRVHNLNLHALLNQVYIPASITNFNIYTCILRL